MHYFLLFQNCGAGRKYGRYAGFEVLVWTRIGSGSQICKNFWDSSKIDRDSDIFQRKERYWCHCLKLDFWKFERKKKLFEEREKFFDSYWSSNSRKNLENNLIGKEKNRKEKIETKWTGLKFVKFLKKKNYRLDFGKISSREKQWQLDWKW